MMDLAADDLHGKEIGSTYLCTKTTKKWLPVLKVISVTLGSSSGLFSGIFSYIIVAFARRYDRHNNTRRIREAQTNMDKATFTNDEDEDSFHDRKDLR